MDALDRTVLIVPSPVGQLTLTAEGGLLTAVGLGEPAGAAVDAAVVRRAGVVLVDPVPADPLLADAADQLVAYFAGKSRGFDLPLAPHGTPFEFTVWRALRGIPYGETVSYGRLAALIGRPKAARAVGRACARNPLPIVVPCHRVIGAHGALTGYAGGLAMKATLLVLEAAAAPGFSASPGRNATATPPGARGASSRSASSHRCEAAGRC